MALVEIPAGTPSATCRSCKGLVYWIVTSTGKRMPVEVRKDDTAQEYPSASEHGVGVSHFAHCPDAEKWRQKKQAGKDTP